METILQRIQVALGVLLSLFLCACSGQEPSSASLATGKALYAKYCSLCHGERGEGYKADGANALSHPDFLATASDAFLTRGIVYGRPGTSMSAWGQERGGPLSVEDVKHLVGWIRQWQTKQTIATEQKTVSGVASRGELLFEFNCITCHGKKGEGGTYMSLNNPEFLQSVSDGYLWYAIAKGRSETPMLGYENKLTAQGIEDLVALIRSWQTKTKPTDPVPARTYEPLVVNQGGPDPTFAEEGRFISVDAVKTEMDRGAAMILADARPPADYVTEHIRGAVSVPFYEATQYLEKLPKNVWIVCYCACPHAESGVVYDTLKKQGYTKIKVLDEGFDVWKQKQYPLKQGPNP